MAVGAWYAAPGKRHEGWAKPRGQEKALITSMLIELLIRLLGVFLGSMDKSLRSHSGSYRERQRLAREMQPERK